MSSPRSSLQAQQTLLFQLSNIPITLVHVLHMDISFQPEVILKLCIYMTHIYIYAIELYAMIFIASNDIDSHLLCLFLTRLYKGQFDIVLFTQIQT